MSTQNQQILAPSRTPTKKTLGMLFGKPIITPPQGFAAQAFDKMVYENFDTMAYNVDWFNQSWNKRIPLTINVGQVPSTQTNFPLLINSIFPDLIGAKKDELRFTTNNNRFLPYEIPQFNSLTGLLIAHTVVPKLQDLNTFKIYYDSPGAADAQDSTKVWDVNYKGVWHMNDPDIDNIAKDSTRYGNDMTRFGTTLVPGRVGNARNFLGTLTDYFIKNPFTEFPSTEITCEYSMKSGGDNDGMISYAIGSNPFDNIFLIFDQPTLLVRINNDFEQTDVMVADNIFHDIVVRWRLSPDGLMDVFVDGDLVYSATGQGAPSQIPPPAAIPNGGSLIFGQDQDNAGGGFDVNQSYNGILDEISLSYKYRSDDYIKTRFNNKNIATFYNIGTTQNRPTTPLDIMRYE